MISIRTSLYEPLSHRLIFYTTNYNRNRTCKDMKNNKVKFSLYSFILSSINILGYDKYIKGYELLSSSRLFIPLGSSVIALSKRCPPHAFLSVTIALNTFEGSFLRKIYRITQRKFFRLFSPSVHIINMSSIYLKQICGYKRGSSTVFCSNFPIKRLA